MSAPFVVAVAALATFCVAARYAEIRLRVMIGRLNERLDGLDSRIRGLESDEGLSSPGRVSTPGWTRKTEPPPGAPSRRIDAPRASAVFGPSLIEIPDIAVQQLPSGLPSSNDLEGRFGEIWASGDLGLPPERIASETGLPRGEVELILGLRKRNASAVSERSGDHERGVQ